ncbi:ATP-binding domain-containing protein, partial [Rhodovulum sulfidophilum]|uniref:ATP-dependent helicase n=1 Tax=Rhodovulum sulfidophilum TaxID=35806 RepID=UPI001924D162
SHQMRAFEDRFLTIGLPYRVIGGPRFYERMEIRDAMAYFRLAVSPADDLAFERIVNTPKRGLGDKAQQKIQATARAEGVPLVEGARRLLESDGLGGKGGAALRTLISLVDDWHFLVANRGSESALKTVRDEILDLASLDFHDLPDEEREVAEQRRQSQIALLKRRMEILQGNHALLAEDILDGSGYTLSYFKPQTDEQRERGEPPVPKDAEAAGRLENLKELVKALEEFDNLQGFLEHVALIMDNESEASGAKISVMTLHAAKGLEFPVVFLPGWEDGLFPSQRAMDETGLKGLEEERRLAYVGLTRAEELCTVSFAANRRVYGKWQSQLPSRFIDELPPSHVDVLTPPGLYGGGYGAAAPQAAFSGIEARASRADVYNSPGWQRLQSRNAGRAPAAPSRGARAGGVVIDAEAVPVFELGARVFHQKFGYGTVTGIEGDKLDIAFDKAGAKKVVARFVVAAASADDVPF